MSIMATRGGIPHVFRETIATVGRYHAFPWIIKYLQIRVSSNPCKLFFSLEDFTNDVNYIQVPVASTTTPYGEWQGPVEANGIWLKGVTGDSNIELVAYQRRG